MRERATRIRTTTAGPATETEISRIRRTHGLRGAIAIVALSLLGAAACGGSKQGPFAWLKPQPVPSGWGVASIPTGAQLAYPPGWRTIHGDPGTATAALIAPGGRYVGYLNVTPKQGNEQIAGWASFRLSHNADEGDRNITRLASGTGLRFLTGTGSCVKDAYTTSIGVRYIETACIVKGSTSTSVVVGATTPGTSARITPLLERAISGFRT
ncbi:MAG TPA: hypothetical protein VMP89_11940 [Solirubrobacteraceae bacterium]|nr:hypothetical protein [Solirubrobacteraceae bacterium]